MKGPSTRQFYCPWLLFSRFYEPIVKRGCPRGLWEPQKKLQKMRGVPPTTVYPKGGRADTPLTSPHSSFFREVVSEKSRRSWKRLPRIPPSPNQGGMPDLTPPPGPLSLYGPLFFGRRIGLEKNMQKDFFGLKNFRSWQRLPRIPPPTSARTL